MVMLTLMVMMMMVDGDDGDDHDKCQILHIVQGELLFFDRPRVLRSLVEHD